MANTEEKFYEVDDDTKSTFMKVFEKKAFPININFQFLGNAKQKELIKISKLSDMYSFLMSKEMMVTFNEDLLIVFDEESIGILIEQEIDKISIDTQSGKIKMIKPDLSTFSAIINKYSLDKVARANQVEELYEQQIKDGREEITF